MIRYSDKTFRPKYQLGEIVYYRTATDKIKGIVTCLKLYVDDGMAYEISWPDRTSSVNFENELTNVFIQDFDE